MVGFDGEKFLGKMLNTRIFVMGSFKRLIIRCFDFYLEQIWKGVQFLRKEQQMISIKGGDWRWWRGEGNVKGWHWIYGFLLW